MNPTDNNILSIVLQKQKINWSQKRPILCRGTYVLPFTYDKQTASIFPTPPILC